MKFMFISIKYHYSDILLEKNINFIYSADLTFRIIRIIEFNRAEPTCYRTNFLYASSGSQKWSFVVHSTTTISVIMSTHCGPLHQAFRVRTKRPVYAPTKASIKDFWLCPTIILRLFVVHSTTRNAPYIHQSHDSILELWRTLSNDRISQQLRLGRVCVYTAS